jgi:hypothetical protein
MFVFYIDKRRMQPSDGLKSHASQIVYTVLLYHQTPKRPPNMVAFFEQLISDRIYYRKLNGY